MLTGIFEGVKTDADKRQRLATLKEAVRLKKVDPKTFDTRDIAEAAFSSKELRALSRSNEAELAEAMRENVAPVNQSLFTNITLLLVNQGVVEGYQSPEYIGDKLVTVMASSDDNVQLPGITPIAETAESEVPEGEEFPTVKVGEDYITTPRSKKYGLKIGVTKEALFFDRTGQILEQAQAVGERCGTRRELAILRMVLGITNSFSRKGVTRNTYVASADPRINQLAANPLLDWHALDKAWQGFNALRDDRAVPEPIAVTAKTLLVPQNLVFQANRIIKATSTREDTAGISGDVTKTYGSNPIPSGMVTEVLSSQWLEWLYQANSLTELSWYIGDFKKAFGYRQVFPLQVIAAAPNSQAEFDRDVVAQFRASERGVPYIKAPWYVQQNLPV